MYAPLPSPPPVRRSPRVLQRRRSSPLARRLAAYTPVFELSARLAVNGVITVASLVALSHLIPYIQTQTNRLDQVSHALDAATTSHTKLKAEFDRYFDPAQASRLMQEYSGYKAPQDRHIVWLETPSR
ncbi:MAG: hypothetical protein VKI82_04790 [Leptolyngbya sp.]|nr:hypothetical protein [Leptolyngbya sp.]